MIVEICEIVLFTRATPGSSLVNQYLWVGSVVMQYFIGAIGIFVKTLAYTTSIEDYCCSMVSDQTTQDLCGRDTKYG